MSTILCRCGHEKEDHISSLGRCASCSGCTSFERLKFVAVDRVIMRGEESIARARTHSMALRIANALNVYVPNKKGF